MENENAKRLGRRIEAFESGERMRKALENLAYYDTENPDINARKKYFVGAAEDGGTMRAVAKENRFAANEHVSSTFFRDITDSKVQYLAGEGADVNAADDSGAEVVQAVYAPISDDMRRVEQETLTDALIYGRGYTYVQVIDGKVTFTCVPYTEVIPHYDKYGELDGVTRYYKRDGVEYAEDHTPDTVTKYERARGEKEWREVGTVPQIVTTKVYPDGAREVLGGRGWPRIPWVEMWHNKQGTTSLTNGAKSMIRVYDITASDFANNLIDVQDVFINLKDSYGSGMDYGEQLEMLRNFKAGENIESVTTFEIPYLARKTLLEMMKSDIYEALRGVDVSLISGGQLTNTAIKALYTHIDLWADQAEWYLADWVRAVMGLVAWYEGAELPRYFVQFTRRAIFDEVAQMQAVASQKGIVSDMTLWENHPLVKDAQQEAERMAAEDLDPAYSQGL